MFNQKKTLLIGAVSAALIWIINNNTPAGFVVWIALVPLLALLAKNLTPRQVGWMAAAFAFVILAGYWTRPVVLPPHLGLANRAFGAASVALLAYWIIRHKRADASLLEMDEKLLAMERREADEALRQSEERFRGLFEHTLDAVILFEQEKVIAINDAACRMFGYEKEKCETLCRGDIVLPQDRGVLSCVPETECFQGEMTFVRRDGSLFKGEASSFALPGSDGSVRTGMAIRDITERKELERARADFISMLTHDLKSPLTTIMGYTELLGQVCPAESPEASDMVEAIQKSSEKMLDMINDFLIVSRLEAGKMEIAPTTEDIAATLDRIMHDFMPAAEKKGIRLEKDYDVLPRACVDKKYMERSVSNLLQNAVNYTPEGGTVKLKAESGTREGGKRRGPYLAVTVEDTGPGIPDGDREKIFDMYFTVPRKSGKKGTGLGLAIVKAVAEAHGGRAAVESEPGRGSAFHIYMPLRTAC